MRTTAYFGIAALLMLSLAAPAIAQEPQEAADLKAYRPIYDPATPTDRKAELAESFLAETSPVFIESTYRENVYLILFQSYRQQSKWAKVVETIDRLEKVVPKTAPEKRLAFFEQAMTIAAAELKDTKKAVAYAEKIIALNSKHVNALLTLATAIPEGAQEPELNKVIDYGKRVLDLPRPEGVAEDQWQTIRNAILVQNQSLVALMVSNKKDYVACAKAYEDLIKLSPKDPNAYYRMGICLYFQVTSANQVAVAANKAHIAYIEECNKDLMCDTEENKGKIADLKSKDEELRKNFEDMREKAIEAFAKAVAIGGGGQEIAAARTELEKLYRTKKPDAEKPLDGLDDLIAQKKKELGE